MASQSPEASEIRRRGRQRLIGAVAIALLLIVFVPMLLDSEPRAPRQEPTLDIPPKENAPPLPAPRPAEPQRAEAAKVEPQKAEAAKVEPPKAEAASPPPKVAVVAPKPAEKPAEKPAPKAASAAGKFAIQVGAFKDDDTLKHAREKLSAANIQSYTEPSGDLTRLRVGPFPTREAAEKTAAVVRKAVPEAKVVPLQ
jgi:DedD protein